MKLALVQFTPWDKTNYCRLGDFELSKGNFVFINTDFGKEMGQVAGVVDISEDKVGELGDLDTIEQLASGDDVEALRTNNSSEKKEEALSYCRKLVKRHGLDMKLVDCYFSFDDRRAVFAFIADGRVDFRSLVKELTRHFQRSIRLHQLGVRDEAKICGDVGSCGLGLCCRGHLKKLGNVTSDLAEQQQVAHRGSERLSGVCGRLKCCLAYEQDLYEELSKKLPAVGTRVRTQHGRGVVIGWHTLRQSVDVKIDPEKPEENDKPLIVEVPIRK